MQDETVRMQFGFLYQGYSFHYWETIDMTRKLIIGAIPVFIPVQPLGSIQVTLAQGTLCMRRWDFCGSTETIIAQPCCMK